MKKRRKKKRERRIAQLIWEVDPRRGGGKDRPNTGGIIGLNSASPRATHLPTIDVVVSRSVLLPLSFSLLFNFRIESSLKRGHGLFLGC